MIDHRTVTGAARREKTRNRLLKGALHVFSQFGAEAKVIDLVIQNAGVSRGTFYNYFRTNEALFTEVAKEVSNEIIRAVDPIVLHQSDPCARIACGIISVLKLAQQVPIFAQFVVKGGPAAMSMGNLATEVVARDISAGITTGQFTITNQQLAFDLVLGPVIMAFHRIVQKEITEMYPKQLAQSVLQSLGVREQLAQNYVQDDYLEIELPEHSMLF